MWSCRRLHSRLMLPLNKQSKHVQYNMLCSIVYPHQDTVQHVHTITILCSIYTLSLYFASYALSLYCAALQYALSLYCEALYTQLSLYCEALYTVLYALSLYCAALHRHTMTIPCSMYSNLQYPVQRCIHTITILCIAYTLVSLYCEALYIHTIAILCITYTLSL